MSKTMVGVFIFVAFVIGGFVGFFVEKTRADSAMEQYKMEVQKQMESSKVENDKMMKEDNSTMDQTEDGVMMEEGQDDKMMER